MSKAKANKDLDDLVAAIEGAEVGDGAAKNKAKKNKKKNQKEQERKKERNH
jgi:hypothetical protein